MAQDKRSQIKKYFAKFPWWAVALIVIGLGLLATKGPGAIGLGVVAIALGIWLLVTYYRKPTDAQMDAWIQEDLKGLRERAMAKTGLEQSELVGETVMVYGPRFWNVGGAEVGIKKGKDGIVRFMPLGVTVINFTPNQLGAYQCALDLTTGNPLSESTDEYFYRDVVSVATQSKTVTWDRATLGKKAARQLRSLLTAGKLQFNAAETFTLTTSGGTSVEVVLRDPKLIERAGGGTIPTEMAEKAVQAVRKMLREKKAAAASA